MMYFSIGLGTQYFIYPHWAHQYFLDNYTITE